jgi:predicted protein tyrosine phosphatase
MERSMPHCIFMPRREVERLVPESGTHLISISDDADDQASIDESLWSSVSYHHFVDAGFDEEIINLYGPEFELHYADYFLATKAETLRQRLKELADQRKNIVINCQAGRSRSAAVAMYLAHHHGYKLNKPTPDANLCVYRMLVQDASLLEAYNRATSGHSQEKSPASTFFRLLTWLRAR